MTAIRLQVRPRDCDSFGHVNNAVYVGYLELALAEALSAAGLARDWRPAGQFRWQIGSLEIEFRQPALFGDALLANIWLDRPDRLHPSFGFEIQRAEPGVGEEPGQTICRARAAWSRRRCADGQPEPLPPDWLASLPQAAGSTPKSFALPPDSLQVRRYHWNHQVMRGEADPNGYVHPQAAFDWLEESMFAAAAGAGWTIARMKAADFLTLQIRHDTQWLASPRLDDQIQVTSRLVQVRRLRGTWMHEVQRLPGRDVLVRDHSTGVFLNLAGRPASPPPGMMEQIQFGRPGRRS